MTTNGSSSGISAVEVCIAKVMVSNSFERVVLTAHRALRAVLDLRKESLCECERDKNSRAADEFNKIFGTKVDKQIYGNKTALMIMQDGLRRISAIHDQMIRMGDDGKMTCYYLNNTICGGFTARVNGNLDKNYSVFIAQKFLGLNVTGSESQVGVLCHEMSHFVRAGEGGINGGMGTGDLNANGEDAFLTAEGHKKAAKQMVYMHSRDVFRSAYNIERYFEISLDNNTLSNISKAVEDDMKKELKIIQDDTPPPTPEKN